MLFRSAKTHASCKHVLAVLKRVSGFILPERPKGKTASLQFLANMISNGVVLVNSEGVSRVASRVAARYLRRVQNEGSSESSC